MAAGQYVQTNDSRLTDTRPPAPGSANYIQNATSAQTNTNFNISGNGTAGGTLSAAQFSIGNNLVLSVTGTSDFPNSNTFLGIGAGTNTSGASFSNSFFGNMSGNKTTTGIGNSFFGNGAGASNTTGAQSSFFGLSAGFSSNGDQNTFIGDSSGGNTTTGMENTFVGSDSGGNNIAGSQNAFFGFRAGIGSNSTGNSFFGAFAGSAITSGTNNTIVGQRAGVFQGTNSSGSNNTLIGSMTDVGSTAVNATAIGACALVSRSNSLVLGSISGDTRCFSAPDTNVGIGTTAPSKRLEIGASTIADGVNLFGTAPSFFLSDTNKTEKGALGFAGNPGLYSTDALAGDVVLRATTNRLIFQHGSGGAGLILNAAGFVQVQNLPSGGGSTQLCRNGSNEITTCNSSSLRYKTNVAKFSGGLNIINRLRPISFTWKTDGVKDIGFGAEEVEKVAPLFTFRNDKGEIEGVRYDRLSVLFVNAFQEQQAQLEEQRQEITRRRQEILKQQWLIEQQQAELVRQERELKAVKDLLCRSHRRAAVCQ